MLRVTYEDLIFFNKIIKKPQQISYIIAPKSKPSSHQHFAVLQCLQPASCLFSSCRPQNGFFICGVKAEM